MARKVHILTVPPAENFRLVAVASHENDYRICWIINHALGIRLSRSPNLHLTKQEEDAGFSMFSYFDKDRQIEYQLIANRCETGFLLQDQRNVDFFLKIYGDSERVINDILTILKKTEGILTAFELSLNPRQKKNFV